MSRSHLLSVASLVALALTVGSPDPAAAQLSFGLHATQAHDLFDRTTGVGGRVALDLPLAPFGAALNGDLFFPDCGDQDCSYRSASLDVQFRLVPIPVVRPYLMGAYVVRRVELPGADEAPTDSGLAVGLGVDVGLAGLGVYLEARYEFVGGENQWVTRLGLLF